MELYVKHNAHNGSRASRVTMIRSPTKYLPLCSRNKVRSWSQWSNIRKELLPVHLWNTNRKEDEKKTTKAIAKLFASLANAISFNNKLMWFTFLLKNLFLRQIIADMQMPFTPSQPWHCITISPIVMFLSWTSLHTPYKIILLRVSSIRYWAT